MRIDLITTGGTIEKTYDERSGELTNRGSIINRMLARLRLEGTSISIRELLSKDSRDITDDDRNTILKAVKASLDLCDGIIVLHGTDTLEHTGELLYEKLKSPTVPIVLTGALRPFEMKRSDALQNLTEALLAASIMPPGVYVAAHGNLLPFPGVKKDHERGTFVKDPA